MQRRREPELMDDPYLDPVLHRQALNDLAFLNMLSGSPTMMKREVLTEVSRLESTIAHTGIISESPQKPKFKKRQNKSKSEEAQHSIRLLDIATGAGDIPIAIAKAAKQHGINLDITASDVSEQALEYVKANADHNGVAIKTMRFDALADTLKTRYDIVTTSLFTHHLDPPDVVKLLRSMASLANHLVLVNDLVRSSGNLTLIKIATKLLTSSEIVQYDGPVSVKAAYTTDEMNELAQSAGLTGAKVEPRFPCRMLLSWRVTRESE